jgi:hypothetical protein
MPQVQLITARVSRLVIQFAVQVAPGATNHAPLVHAKLAAPVVGAVASVSAALKPEAVALAAPSQVLPPTVQLSAPAAHAMGAVHDVLVAAPHAPLLQAKLAAPVVGAVLSVSTALAPEAVAPAVASQVLPLTVQLRGPAAQAIGAVQLAPGATAHAPLVHVKLAAPVVGAVLSVSVALEPEAAAAAAPSQVLAPTVQFKAAALQAMGAVHDTLVGVPQTPLVQV